MRRFLATYRWEIALVAAIPALIWGWWALWASDAVHFYGLTYDLAWWSARVVLPALLVWALYLRLRRRGYTWESLLLVAIPYWASIAGAAYVAVVFRTSWFTTGGAASFWLILPDWGIPSQLVTVILLTALYPAIRRTERNFLLLTWQFILAFEVIGLVVDSLFAAIWLRGVPIAVLTETWDPRPLNALLSGPLAMFLLLGFIRRASRFSLAHAVFMVVLAFSFSWSGFFAFGGGSPETREEFIMIAGGNTALHAAHLGIAILAAWLLFNFDARGPLFRRRAVWALVALRTVGALVLVVLGMLLWGPLPMLRSDTTVLLMLGVTLLAWLATFWAVNLLRVRHSTAEAEPTPDTPPNEER